MDLGWAAGIRKFGFHIPQPQVGAINYGFQNERCMGTSSPTNWMYCQSIGKVPAKVLRNLVVLQPTPSLEMIKRRQTVNATNNLNVAACD